MLRTCPGTGSVVCKQILGGVFRFEGDSRGLLDLVEAAYGGLRLPTLAGADRTFNIRMRCSPSSGAGYAVEPPAPRIHFTPDRISAVVDEANFVLIEPERRRAQIAVSEDMLRHAYHLRYELIEFAVFILATRGLGLVPLHAACVGRNGVGLLLLGDSGAGKSTLALHCLLHGLELLAEDAVFVRSPGLLAMGIPNYLHLRADALDGLDDRATRQWVARAPVIRRRSGVEKFEVDLRTARGNAPGSPLQLVGTVFVSARAARPHAALLAPMRRHVFRERLTAGQPNASRQPGWERFRRSLLAAGAHRLCRGRHPGESVDALRRLLP